jgi:C-terminal processing protease CtpA/Prc
MLRFVRCVCILLACLLASPLQVLATNISRPQTETDVLDRLVGLCRLWGYVKYFHPGLAHRSDIDWDAALVSTIPKVRSARNSTEYAGALQSLLENLGDPATHVISTQPQTVVKDAQKLGFELTDDGVLVITVGNYYELWNADSQQKLKQLIETIPKAKTLVLDLRSKQPVDPYGRLVLTSSFGPIERLLISRPLLGPGERSLVHRGYQSSAPFSSGQYRSGFYLQGVKRITAAPTGREIPTVFLINKHSALLESTIATQVSGTSLIVAEGGVDPAVNVKSEVLNLPEGVSVQVRTAETMLEDGGNGDLQPDVVVNEVGQVDSARKTALDLARNFKRSTIARRKLPATASFATEKSYSQMKYPASEYRLLTAFRIWNIVQYFYPYKELMGEDWEATLKAFISRFEQAKDELDYSLTVAEMMTMVHDSHAYVSGDVINNYFGASYPPIRARLIENALVVTHFYDEEVARKAGMKIGDVILTVDGEDAKARFERYAKYISASTPQSRNDKAALAFMNGKEGSTVTLVVRNAGNKSKEVKLPRKFEDYTTLYHRERSGEIMKLLPGNIGYVDLDRLPLNQVDTMLERFKATRAIVFDMRGYPNGVFWTLPQRLTDKGRVAAALIETPLVGTSPAANSSESFLQLVQPRPVNSWVYKGQTVMLMDERALSQAEHTGLFLRAANGTKFIGSHTGGANGEITTFSLPGGIGTGITGQSVKFPDGRQLQRLGLTPDIEVRPTIKGIQAGRDEVLERAVEYLRRRTSR